MTQMPVVPAPCGLAASQAGSRGHPSSGVLTPDLRDASGRCIQAAWDMSSSFQWMQLQHWALL